MSLSKRAQDTLAEIEAALSTGLSTDERARVTQAIEKALIEAVLATTQRSSNAVNRCCSADQDLAHKLHEEIERNREVLIANLSAMR